MTVVSKAHKIALSNVEAWFKTRKRLREMAKPIRRGDARHHSLPTAPSGKVASQNRSRIPGGGRKAWYVHAEQHLFKQIQQRRSKGIRVSTAWVRGVMLKTVREQDPKSTFRASQQWVTNFLRRHQLSVRVKTNGKHLSVQDRLPRIQKWHRDLRARLVKEGSGGDPKWGLYPPERRLNVDQVPYSLGGMSKRTVATINSKRVWLKGKKSGVLI